MVLEKKMKTGFNKYWAALVLFMGLAFVADFANAIGTMIATALSLQGATAAAVAFIINVAVSAVIAKNAASQLADKLASQSNDLIDRQTIPPATNNKVPVVYGSAWTGGTIIDMSISDDNQWIQYVMALTEVTDNGNDVLSFGDIYYGGRQAILGPNTTDYDVTLYQDTLTQIYFKSKQDTLIGKYVSGSHIPANTQIIEYLGYESRTAGRNGGHVYKINNSLTGMSATYAETVQVSPETNPSSYSYKVTGLLDTSVNILDETIAGNLFIYLYTNGSDSNANSPYSAYQVMSSGGFADIDLTYQWTGSHIMTNCAFAIVQMKYNQDKSVTGIQQMKFQVNNTRNAPGDCFVDYFTNTVYGAGLNQQDGLGNYTQIDTASFSALNTYCAQPFTYTLPAGGTATQNRFQFNGVIDTSKTIMDNLQEMATSCDCLIKYNEITGLWGVIVQQPTYTVAMDINDSNMINAITVNPTDLSSAYNVIECKFPDVANQDSFNVATFDLAQLAPSLLYPNEPINKQTVTLSMVNNSVTAQYIANRLLEAGREDLNITCTIDYSGLQLEAGDVVTVTNANYGWSAKLFRIMKITEQFGSDGTITAALILSEFNPQVYDDRDITEFSPAPNTSLPSALTFGELAAPTITNQTPIAAAPYFYVNVTAPSSGIAQYAEIYYSTTSTADNAIFAGTTEIQPSGDNYGAGEAMPPVILTGVPAGNWYVFYKIVNGLGTSGFSLPSDLLYWRPMTFQYPNRYLMLAYATSSDGATGFSFNPRGKSYFGIMAVDSIQESTLASDYTWFTATPTFGTTNYLLYTNWGNRSISYAVSTADYYSGTGNFVSTDNDYSGVIWSGVIDPIGTEQTYIDLDSKSGQNLITGMTKSYGTLDIQPNTDGRLQVALNKFLSFGTDGSGAEILQKTVTPALLTVDIYGRVVGFEDADSFYVTIKNFTATSGQTVFNNTRASTYRAGNCLVFENGVLVDTADYTDSAGSTGTVTFTTGRTLGDLITIVSFRSYHVASAGSFVVGLFYTIVSLGTTTNAQWNTIAGTSGITYAVGSTFTCANTGAGLGTGTASTIYDSFSRFTQAVTAATVINPTNPVTSGYEYLFFNGLAMPDPDYDIVGTTITNFPAPMTGTMTVIQWTANNLSVPNGNPYNVYTYTASGVTSYTFGLTPYAFNLYENGVLQINGTTTPSTFTPNDYTTGSGSYTLGVSPTSNTNILVQQSFTRTGAA